MVWVEENLCASTLRRQNQGWEPCITKELISKDTFRHPPLNPLLYEPWPSREGKILSLSPGGRG
jgi:hypothetical protein